MGKKEVVLASDIILRLTIPLFLWQNPVSVTVLATLADTCDGATLSLLSDIKRETYQRLDKILDHYFFTVALIYLWGKPLFLIFLFFYLLRLCGIALLYITGSERVLLFFPNVIEFIFFLYAFTLWQPQYLWLLSEKNLYFSVGTATIIKAIQEYLMHRRYFCLRKKILELLGLERLAELVSGTEVGGFG